MWCCISHTLFRWHHGLMYETESLLKPVSCFFFSPIKDRFVLVYPVFWVICTHGKKIKSQDISVFQSNSITTKWVFGVSVPDWQLVDFLWNGHYLIMSNQLERRLQSYYLQYHSFYLECNNKFWAWINLQNWWCERATVVPQRQWRCVSTAPALFALLSVQLMARKWGGKKPVL